MMVGSLQKVRIAVSCLIDVWDAKANEWRQSSSPLESVFDDKKICIRITKDGMVRYIATDQPARPQLTRSEE